MGYLAYGYFSPDAAANRNNWPAAVLAGVGFLVAEPLRRDAQKAAHSGMQGRVSRLHRPDDRLRGSGARPEAAIDRLSREIAKAHPILGAHLYLASLEIRAGSSLHQALFNLSRRTQVDGSRDTRNASGADGATRNERYRCASRL